MPAVITPTSALSQLTAAAEAAPDVVLQTGAVIDARVLAVRDNLARILIAGLSIDVLTEVALQPGANLKLAVSQTADGNVRLAVVTPDVATQGRAAAASAGGTAAAIPVSRPRQALARLRKLRCRVFRGRRSCLPAPRHWRSRRPRKPLRRGRRAWRRCSPTCR